MEDPRFTCERVVKTSILRFLDDLNTKLLIAPYATLNRLELDVWYDPENGMRYRLRTVVALLNTREEHEVVIEGILS